MFRDLLLCRRRAPAASVAQVPAGVAKSLRFGCTIVDFRRGKKGVPITPLTQESTAQRSARRVPTSSSHRSGVRVVRPTAACDVPVVSLGRSQLRRN